MHVSPGKGSGGPAINLQSPGDTCCLERKDQHLFDLWTEKGWIVMNRERLNLYPLIPSHEILSLFWMKKLKTDKQWVQSHFHWFQSASTSTANDLKAKERSWHCGYVTWDWLLSDTCAPPTKLLALFSLCPTEIHLKSVPFPAGIQDCRRHKWEAACMNHLQRKEI